MNNAMPPSVTEPASAVFNSSHYLAECTVIGLAILSAVIVGSIAALFVQCVHISVNRLRHRHASRKKHRAPRGTNGPWRSSDPQPQTRFSQKEKTYERVEL